MLKQFIIIVIISALAIFFMHQFVYFLHLIGNTQSFLITKIAAFLPKLMLYKLIVKIFVIIIIPVILALFAAFIYWLIKRKEMPKLMEIIWVLWIISLLVYALYK